MSWGEAYRLTVILTADPSTALAAAVNEWDAPRSREWFVLADLFDLTHQIAWAQGGGKGGKPKPYLRPWPSRTTSRPRPDPSLTQDEIVAALRKAGHTAPLPGEQNMEGGGSDR